MQFLSSAANDALQPAHVQGLRQRHTLQQGHACQDMLACMTNAL